MNNSEGGVQIANLKAHALSASTVLESCFSFVFALGISLGREL